MATEATKLDSKCVPPTTTSISKAKPRNTHDSLHHRHEMKQSQKEDDLLPSATVNALSLRGNRSWPTLEAANSTATFNTAARSLGTTRRRSQLGCMFDRRRNARRDEVHATNNHQGDAACAVCPMHLAEIPNLPQANQPRRVRWRGAIGIPPPRETPATAATTGSVLISRPSRTSTRLAPYISPANSLGPCEPATGCHDPTKPPQSV